MPNPVGQQFGNYRLVRLLGQGGFSEVYLGEHVYLKVFAAIRVLQTKLASDEREYFITEARFLASLRHPNIVPISEFGVENTTPYLVMGYAPNGTLRQRYPKGTLLPLASILSYTKQVAAALQYAHDRGVIHTDVKPENMLLGTENEVLLSDFGIAIIAASSGHQTRQEVAGTISYMAPEQIQGNPRAASDQYSLGIVVYEWLCGERPFLGTFTEVAGQHMFVPPPSLREKVPTISPEVEQVVMLALAKDPKQRFGSMQAFANALEQAISWSRPSPITFPRQTANPNLPDPLIPSLNWPPPLPLATTSKPTYTTPALSSTANVPSSIIGPLSKQSKSRIPRRTVLVGLVGLLGLGAAEAVSAITALRTHSPGTPTPTPLPKNFTYLGHTGEVNTVAWSPDGKFIASGSRDNTARVWSSTTGNTILIYNGHSNWVSGVAWSSDGKRIASASADDTVQVWDAITGSHLITYKGHNASVQAVAWSPDGRRIASASGDATVQVWDAVNGSNVYTYRGHTDAVNAVAWSPDGRRIASGCNDKTVQVWDAVDGGNFYTYRGHSAEVDTVEWSPDSKRIASGSADRTAQVWDAPTGGQLFTFTYHGHSYTVRSVAWSPDGKRIASGSADRTVQVWDTIGGHIFIYRGHTNWVNDVVWSPDGRRIASASADKTVQVWQAA